MKVAHFLSFLLVSILFCDGNIFSVVVFRIKCYFGSRQMLVIGSLIRAMMTDSSIILAYSHDVHFKEE